MRLERSRTKPRAGSPHLTDSSSSMSSLLRVELTLMVGSAGSGVGFSAPLDRCQCLSQR